VEEKQNWDKDHEILVNTILEEKKREIKELKQKWVEETTKKIEDTYLGSKIPISEIINLIKTLI
jgi:hypothetical protein